MSEPGGAVLAAAVRADVVDVGGKFMRSREMRDAGGDLAAHGWSFYMCGRGGVLGDVDADVVTAAFGFFPGDVVRTGWQRGAAVMSRTESAAAYARACAAWGDARLGTLDGVARLAELAERVAAAADPAGAPVFAAWRAMPRPVSAPARAAFALHLLREHRGGLHLGACLAAGLTPLQAVLAGPLGEPNARYFGWEEPFPDVRRRDRDAHADAERATDAAAGRAYDVLDADEGAELVALLAAARAVVFPEQRARAGG